MNGQFESCGPEGGIRPHLGLETQWYLMGDTMLERRKQDPGHLMSLVVVPGKGHTAWNHQLAALFIRKAAQYRAPEERRDGTRPAKCVRLRAEDGWLSDRNVKYPRCEPAPYADYQGERSEAFWHFDEEMATAVRQYHTDGIRPGQEHSIFRPAGLLEQLWPLGQRMDIPFAGDSSAERAAAIGKWISAKTGMDEEGIVVGRLARGIACGLAAEEQDAVDEATCRNVCVRVCYAYDDMYCPVEEALDETDLPEQSKTVLRSHYAELLLVRWPNGQEVPALPLRAMQTRIAEIPAGSDAEAVRAWLQKDVSSDRAAFSELLGTKRPRRPEDLNALLQDLGSKNTEKGWAAVDAIGRIGAPAIADLIYLMDFGGQPADFRAAAALGLMGKAARLALPDLRRSTLRGGTTEHNGLLSRKSLEAVKAIENDGGR